MAHPLGAWRGCQRRAERTGSPGRRSRRTPGARTDSCTAEVQGGWVVEEDSWEEAEMALARATAQGIQLGNLKMLRALETPSRSQPELQTVTEMEVG